MQDKLAEICAVKREAVSAAKADLSLSALEDMACAAGNVRGFASALSAKVGAGDIGLIGEIKKASPSAGLIRPDFDPVTLAQAYAQGSAACLSVLTDEPYFQGCNEYLKQARAACTLPVLRKDFMVDVWQVAEARAIGADCILIIMAAVEDALAADLHAAAIAYGMDVLIETHDEAEMERALRLPSGLIGINNRNLKTLKTDLATTERLAPLVSQDRDIVCESGIANAQDVARMVQAGVKRFLVGESLMRQTDVAAAACALRPA